MSDLCFLPAIDLVRLIRQREVSAREVLDAHLSQIERLNPAVNAIVTLVEPERAREAAAALDARLARGEATGPLAGLPIAHKDLLPTKGLRTTFGSPLFERFVPDHSALVVERLQAAGALTIGKSNTPELGAGSQTFNRVFGATRNPHDPTKTSGGSSGGAAAALACGLVPIADGTDLGGSLRNPASFCNVCGFRSSPGRVPVWPTPAAWFPFDIHGPMARTVADIALMMTAIAGPDPRAPLSGGDPGSIFAANLARDFTAVRIAWSPTAGGLPMDPRVVDVIAATRPAFEAIGCVPDETFPDLTAADEVFRTWRAWYFELCYGDMVARHPGCVKETVVWNVEEGRKLTGPQLARAERLRTELFHRVRAFLEPFEFLVLPVSQVPPFDVDQPYVTEIAGRKMETYLDWMRSCYLISVLPLPAVAVPAGFTVEGLPVGVQIVGRPGRDVDVLRLAYAFEQATGFWRRRPPMAEA